MASLPIRLSLDRLQTHLLGIIAVGSRATHLPVEAAGPPTDATPAETVEASRKEEENPRGDGEPNSRTKFRLSTIDSVDALLGEEEENEVEDEGDHGDGGGES